MFCLEENSVITLDFKNYPDIACECRIHTHANCWTSFIMHKGHVECPICHKIFENQYRVTPPTPVIIVHVPQEEINQCQRIREKICGLLCIFLLFVIMFSYFIH
jgi:hypothetical protein